MYREWSGLDFNYADNNNLFLSTAHSRIYYLVTNKFGNIGVFNENKSCIWN